MSEAATTGTVGTTLVKAFGLLGRLGRGVPEDGWRRLGRGQMCGEATRYAIATLGLRRDLGRAPSVEAPLLARALATFLRRQPDTHCALEWHRHEAVRISKSAVDVTWARFDVSGRLLSIEPFLDERVEVPYERFLRGLLVELVIEACNATRYERELHRPLALELHVMAAIDGLLARTSLPQDAWDAATFWVWRVLTSTMVTFERLDSANDARRLCTPSFVDARSFGLGALHARLRLVGADSVDVWLEASPVAVDAAPLTEMLEALAADWGRTPVLFATDGDGVGGPAPKGHPDDGTVVSDDLVPPVPAPPPGRFDEAHPAEPHVWGRAIRCAADAPPHVYASLDLLDFEPFWAMRRELGDVSPTAMLLWMLAHQPAFANRRFAVTVDVPPPDASPPDAVDARRTVGMFGIRPADYFPGAFSGAGFAAFQMAFEREAVLTRKRASSGWRTVDRLGLVPSSQQRLIAPYALPLAMEAFGTVGVSVLRQAEVFLAPWHPLFVDGFLAFGDLVHGAIGGQTRGAVSVKGGRRRVEACREALAQALAAPPRWFSSASS